MELGQPRTRGDSAHPDEDAQARARPAGDDSDTPAAPDGVAGEWGTGNGKLPTGLFVNPTLADWYKNSKWRISHGLELIFKAAYIETSVRIEGRRTRTPEATFHSLRHTFVSLAANAGVPLPVVQSIVGHSSTAMTRHYYHENEEILRQAVAAIPAIGEKGIRNEVGMGKGEARGIKQSNNSKGNVPARLKRLDKYLAQGLITQDEHAVQRARILAEL